MLRYSTAKRFLKISQFHWFKKYSDTHAPRRGSDTQEDRKRVSRADKVAPHAAEPARVRTGVAGLDEILGGGLPRYRMYVVEGDPGTGKTTLALQFLLE